ncbi:hypothetical protein BDV11DRAFT_174045 [Aspergillus similis]
MSCDRRAWLPVQIQIHNSIPGSSHWGNDSSTAEQPVAVSIMIQKPPELAELAESTESDVCCTLYRIPYPVYYTLLYRTTNAGGQSQASACPTKLILGGTAQFTARPLARITPVPVSLVGPSPAWELTCSSA